MSLEKEILAVEESADAIVAQARAEAKKLMGSLEERLRLLREETAARVDAEKARLREEGAARLPKALAAVEKERAAAAAAVKQAEGARAEACVQSILAALGEG
jgi:hypothetical protein